MIYRLFKFSWNAEVQNVIRMNENGSTTDIPFNPANTDYQNFKAEILADESQLEDVDGNVMPPEAAKEYVRSLP
jgi:hypothetical protein